MTIKKSIDIGSGIIDNDYRGGVKVIMINNGENPIMIRAGDKIAQFIFKLVTLPKIEPTSNLTETTRGDGAFGSTDSTKPSTK